MENIKTETVYCLVVDLIDSTRRLFAESTEVRDSFNIALSKVLSPFIKNLDLEDSIIKFAGDGWIISISDPSKINNLVCLAMLLKYKFHSEIEKLTDLKFDREWKLRLGLAHSGNDIRIEINRQSDFIGDSVRRATRISTLCYPNEIIINDTIYSVVFRDFETERIDIDKRMNELNIRKLEEDILLIFSVKKPKISKLRNSHIMLYLFDQLGIEAEKELIINRVKNEADNQDLSIEEKKHIDQTSIYLSTIGRNKDSEVIDKKLKKLGYKRSVIYWNKKINILGDYGSAKAVLDEMKSADIQPDVVTYSTLMNKVDNFGSAKALLDEMKSAGIQPNEVTYSTLMNKADNYESAKFVLDEMKSADIQPNEVTYSTLMNKADNFGSAKALLDEMKSAGIKPNLLIYCTLFSKDIDNYKIEDIHKWYLSEKVHPSSALEPLIKRLFSENKFHDAYYLILNYPYLKSARKIVVGNFELTRCVYARFEVKDFYKKNIDYALGIAYFDIGKLNEAKKHLENALLHALAEERKEHIKNLLKEIELKTHESK